jgi:uncharacterized protein
MMTETTKVKLFKIRCPRCGTLANWQGNPDRPFCSPRCRLIDLGHWADETYRVPAENADEVSHQDED